MTQASWNLFTLTSILHIKSHHISQHPPPSPNASSLATLTPTKTESFHQTHSISIIGTCNTSSKEIPASSYFTFIDFYFSFFAFAWCEGAWRVWFNYCRLFLSLRSACSLAREVKQGQIGAPQTLHTHTTQRNATQTCKRANLDPRDLARASEEKKPCKQASKPPPEGLGMDIRTLLQHEFVACLLCGPLAGRNVTRPRCVGH